MTVETEIASLDPSVLNLLHSAPDVVLQEGGIAQFGKYIELDTIKTVIATGVSTVTEHHKLFVTDTSVSFYSLDPTKSRTVWRHSRYLNAEQVDVRVRQFFAPRAGSVFTVEKRPRGRAILVQLTPADLHLLDQRKAPNSRFAGVTVIEKMCGKFSWGEVNPPRPVPWIGVSAGAHQAASALFATGPEGDPATAHPTGTATVTFTRREDPTDPKSPFMPITDEDEVIERLTKVLVDDDETIEKLPGTVIMPKEEFGPELY